MEKPIRIIHVVGGLDVGGTETLLMNLYRNIDRTKIQFDFIKHTKKKCLYDDEILLLGGKIFSMPRYQVTNHIRYKKEWKKFLKEHSEYKIIHAHMRSTASIYLKIAKKAGLYTIAHSHSVSSGKGVSAIVKNFLQRRIRETADYFLACSHSAGEWLFGKKVVNSANFSILNNAIFIDKFIYNDETRNKKREELNLVNSFVIGHVGRFEKAKNHIFLIEVFLEISEINKNAKLLLVGDGTLKKEIEKKVKEFNIDDKVIFMGAKTDVNELLQAMDVFLFPSLYEGLGISVIEAQAASLPCIISKSIPNDVLISDLVTKISLKVDKNIWVNTTLNSKRDQLLKAENLVLSGYDIYSVSNWLTGFYEKVYEVAK